MLSSVYRGRFAPSPTGPLHFGSLVAALGSYLDARAHGGEWHVRIEDLDPPRIMPGAADDILRTLEACALRWDGPVVRQSSRADAYHAALHALRAAGHVYPCACSRREIADSGVTGIEGYVYPGTCRDGIAPDRRGRAWRVRTQGASIRFTDALQGMLEHDLANQIGDFVIYRSDRVFAYQLAVVIDDAEQGMTDVVRGADLLDSTPRQIHLQRLLGLPMPRYTHFPVAVNARGEKLSKQTLAPAITGEQVAPSLVAALRFLGQHTPRHLELEPPEAICRWAIENWDVSRVPRVRTQRFL
jgi:glutamyl-Q tRNA(Asp) synthetase